MSPAFLMKGKVESILFETFENVAKAAPLVHHITNYVTVHDVANITLAAGASPIMADDSEEAAEITALASGLCLNIGTLNSRTIPSMLAAARKAKELGHPILLDPVGAGATALRTRTALKILSQGGVTCLRGNISEIKALAAGAGRTQGVDAAPEDKVTEENLPRAIDFAKQTARELGATVAITGAIDLVASPDRCYVIRNGRPEMSKITGTGCQCSALTAACLAANPGRTLEAAAAAVMAMGIAGEIAFSHLQPEEGNVSYGRRIIDAVCHLDQHILSQEAKYEIC